MSDLTDNMHGFISKDDARFIHRGYLIKKLQARIKTLERENRIAHTIAGCTQDNCRSNGFECPMNEGNNG